MKYTIYKITNKINGKYYIGKHQTYDLNDGYMGSGRALRQAIKKYGEENFTKEILHVYETEKEMNDKEKDLVVLSEHTYNLCEGGTGGFGYINRNGLGMSQEKAKYMAQVRIEKCQSNTEFAEFWNNAVKSACKGRKFPRPLNWTGRKHSPETKAKMSLAAKNRKQIESPS